MDAVVAELTGGLVDCLKPEELQQRLARGERLRVKLGFDPTAPDLHLGHTVLLNKLRQFVQHGHTAVVIIGDFTALIGDPTGKNVTRKPLSPEVVAENAVTYREQLFKVIPEEGVELCFNSTWMNTINSAGMIRLAALQTVARMLERDDFRKRYQSGQSIALHEFLYPLVQGYDSVAIRADVELGGTDQLFNLLMGRQLQEHYAQTPQLVMTMPLLEGLDGVQKMSKSLGNVVGITDAPDEMYGKLMSLSDTIMWRYFDLLSWRPAAEIDALRAAVAAGSNPRDVKDELAREIVARFHSRELAERASQAFRERFAQGQIPDELTEVRVAHSEPALPIARLLKEAGLTASTSESLRMVSQGAVKVDGERVADAQRSLPPDVWHVVQVGKRRFARVMWVQSPASPESA
jgi:tyrosyl-tRNA synthetase